MPPYSNPPIHPEYYTPRVNTITAVTLGLTTLITMLNDNQYEIGQLVRLLIPSGWGCTQLNEKIGYVIAIPTDNQVEVDISSNTNVNPFVAGPSTSTPQILGIGDINTGQINSFGRIKNLTYIPGSYRNISPQ
ncbi:hypothetical protein UFOVP816_54 [uncultured Caudovirales phage]|uniref:Uncharacterized protein n=1 Tax=uncultured Caudovirales phage TaxID=2100421 RepID=A0A6J5P5T4_9CAUD|nr:hypothetical protein UFOVP816_54 [uncultured Caudovirales phage]